MKPRPSACEQWIALSDRNALGEALSPAESRHVLEHAATCTSCGAESLVYDGLEALLKPAATAHAHTQAQKSTSPRAPAKRSIRRAAAMAGLLVACAAASIAAWPRKPPHAPHTPHVTGPIGMARLSAASGNVEIDGRPARAGQALAAGTVMFARAGRACIVIDPATVRACLAPAGLLRIVEVKGAHRRLEMLAGTLVIELDPQPSGTSFTVATREGTATAIGTAFSVEIPEDGRPVVTRVLHGTVLVQSNAGDDQRLSAHSQASMGGPIMPLGEDAEMHARELLDSAPLPRSAEVAIARVTSTPSGVAVKIDGHRVGYTPVSLLLDPGEHAFEVGDAVATIHDVVHLAPGEQLERDFAIATAPASLELDAAAPSRPAPRGASAERLLLRARTHTAMGDMRGAADAYRELFTRYPRSVEARAARVSYGEIELGPLGDPERALAAFDEYLRSGGPLVEEAAYGRIRALRALGKTDEEGAAIRTFLERFPRAGAASALRGRQ